MLIDIKDIARDGTMIRREIALGSLPGERGETMKILSARVEGVLTRGRDGVDFSGELESRIRLGCVRCLEEFEMPVRREFHLLFVDRLTPPAAGESQVGDDDCDVTPAVGGKVDLKEVVREQIYLGIPLKPLCREDCKGLCPSCGKDLNVDKCSCEIREAGPRNPLPFPTLQRSADR